MAKPTDLPRWAEDTGGTPASNIIEPSSGKKDTGFVTIAESPGGKGDVPTSGGMNWWMRLVYKWAEWLDGLQGEELTWAENQVYSKLLQLGGSALQSILKGGTGGLDIGTSITSDLRVLLNSVAQWTFRQSDGALVSNGKQITGLPVPVAESDGVNKGYVDGIVGNVTHGVLWAGHIAGDGTILRSTGALAESTTAEKVATGHYHISNPSGFGDYTVIPVVTPNTSSGAGMNYKAIVVQINGPGVGGDFYYMITDGSGIAADASACVIVVT